MTQPCKPISSRSQRGQELAEFAIVLPFLFLIIFATLDFGRLFHAAITIANVAREGARYAGLHRDEITPTTLNCNAPADEIVQAACLEAQNSGFNPSRVAITVSCPDGGGCVPYNKARISVAYNFDFLIGSIIGMDGITLRRNVEMMIQ
jgi:hypothetical protein